MNSNLSLTSVGDYCIDEIIHLLEAVAKCVYSATKPWCQRLLKANGEIDKAIGQLEFRLWEVVLFAEVEDVRNTSALGFHQAALEFRFFSPTPLP